MILFPPAKLNLGLQITVKRSDGFHNLQTIFYQFPLRDVLEILKDDSIPNGTCQFSASGLPIPKGENLCEKAYHLLNREYRLPGAKIILHKIIPMGAGLGGGSSDAAYTLKLLNSLFSLSISNSKLMEYALELGSDCPLFITSLPVYAEGRGDVLKEIDLSLKGKYLVVVNCGIHISTAEAFSMSKPKLQNSCEKIVLTELSFWKNNLHNDFEDSVFPKHPVLKSLKNNLYDLGAIYASMSGSGSTMFGLFNHPVSLDVFPKEYFVWQCKL
mgnify:CR=1 FL=1